MSKTSGHVRRRRGVGALVTAAVAATAALAADARAVAAQELADFDYENLSFRGVGVYGGYIWPDAVDATEHFGFRADLGFLGPGVRVMPSVSYWSSDLKASEIRRLEESVERLITRQSGPPSSPVDLGSIERSDLTLGLDAHVVWSIPAGLLTYAGAGASVHFLNGDGEAVNDTFVEDLLDSVTAGFNLHGGFEYPVSPAVRVFTEGRFEVLGDLYYPGVYLGVTFFTGQPAPGEER